MAKAVFKDGLAHPRHPLSPKKGRHEDRLCVCREAGIGLRQDGTHCTQPSPRADDYRALFDYYITAGLF